MTDTNPLWERIEHALWGVTQVYDARDGRGTEVGVHAPVYEVVAAVLPILRLAQAEAVDGFRAGLADHLDLATPRAWDFHHPCDPPDTRWEPTERDQALMAVADMLRHDTRNPYRGEQANG